MGEKDDVLDWYRKESCSRHMNNVNLFLICYH